MKSREEREAAQEDAIRQRWLLLHPEHYERACPLCGAAPGTFCRDEEDGEEMYVVHRERLPEGVSLKVRTRLIRSLDEIAAACEEVPCIGGS